MSEYSPEWLNLTYADEEGTVPVVGRGASNDFIVFAHCGEEDNPTGRYASDAPLPPPPLRCLATIVKNGQGIWEVDFSRQANGLHLRVRFHIIGNARI